MLSTVKRPERDVEPFDLSRWPKIFRHDSFKFIWGINGAANWYREAAPGTFELYDVEGRCFAPATLKSFRTMLKEKGDIPKCRNRQTGRNEHNHAGLNRFHSDYLIHRYRFLASVAMYSQEELTANEVLQRLLNEDTTFR